MTSVSAHLWIRACKGDFTFYFIPHTLKTYEYKKRIDQRGRNDAIVLCPGYYSSHL